MSALKTLLSAFFNLHLRRDVRAVTINKPDLLDRLSPVFAAAEALGFTQPIIRGGAVRDGLEGKEINDYDVYVSRLETQPALKLPSIKVADAAGFYERWLARHTGMTDLKAHRARITERPYVSFKLRLSGIDRPVDLVINDEMLSPEMLSLNADATMNGVAASREKIAAHPRFLHDSQNQIYRPTCATVGDLINSPLRYRKKFAARDAHLRFRLF